MAVRVKPRASKSRVVAIADGLLEVAIAAPPVDGEANAELVRTLAAFFGLPRGRVELLRGATGRNKTICLQGVSLEAAQTALAAVGRKGEGK